jgi:hypothetical protein
MIGSYVFPRIHEKITIDPELEVCHGFIENETILWLVEHVHSLCLA